MLERAMLLGLRNDLRRDDEMEMALRVCTHGGAAAMALPDYGLDVGCAADLLGVDGETVAESVAARPPRRLVLKRGRVVARGGDALLGAP
jgi:cytosine/adenosine deaminase-related metal-dependent hydrolase